MLIADEGVKSQVTQSSVRVENTKPTQKSITFKRQNDGFKKKISIQRIQAPNFYHCAISSSLDEAKDGNSLHWSEHLFPGRPYAVC